MLRVQSQLPRFCPSDSSPPSKGSFVNSASRERDLLPDVLRGFALFGIILVNVSFFSHSTGEGVRGSDVEGLGNSLAAFVMTALFQGKFYLLFSFLFGYSSYYITRGEKSRRSRFALRSFLLVALGALHFTFLWHGDILFTYGLFGLVLLAFLFRRDRTLKIWSWVLWGLSAFVLVSVSLLSWLGEVFGESIEPLASPLDPVMRGGSFADAILPRVELWATAISGALLLQAGLVLGAFLVGVLAARHGLLGSHSSDLRIRTMMVWGFGLGLPLQLLAAGLYVSNELSPETSEAVYLGSISLGFATAPLLSMGYLGALMVLLRVKPVVVSWMRYPGRASLTNYLLQSVALSMIFGPWGLGLFQAVDYGIAVLIAAAVYVLLAGASALWFRRFDQGPMERLMAALTRKQREPSL